MSKEKKHIPAQSLVGRQVFDSKGSLLGTIRDVMINIGELGVAILLDLRSGGTVEIPWSEVQSVEDVVLLKKQSKVYEAKASRMRVVKPEIGEAPPPVSPPTPPPPPSAPPTPPPPPMTICPNCGAKAPSHAKFCPKCGKPLK